MEQLLMFRLGANLYGLEVERIQEILDAPVCHYLPRAPAHFAGAVNFHGSVLPLIDLPGMAGEIDARRDHRVMVLPPAVCAIALQVSAIEGILQVPPEVLAAPGPAPQGTWGRGAVEHEDRRFLLFDAAPLVAHLETI